MVRFQLSAIMGCVDPVSVTDRNCTKTTAGSYVVNRSSQSLLLVTNRYNSTHSRANLCELPTV
jgi:hypothetical protein